MDKQQLLQQAQSLQEEARTLADKAAELATQAAQMAGPAADAAAATGGTPFIVLFTAFVLACFVGVTNAISSVIIVGALIAAGPEGTDISKIFGFLAIVLASVNIFGGFLVTNRMLGMFKKKQKAG